MKNKWILFLITAIIFLPIKIDAQGLCPYLGPDQFLPCNIGSTTLVADFSNCPGGPGPQQTTTYNGMGIPFAPQPVGGTVVPANNFVGPITGDDGVAGPFNIGFTFCFYGNSYTQFYIGSNGWVSFSPNQPATYTGLTIPSTGPAVPKNCIMGPYADWLPNAGGTIRYQTQGVSPCRKLVVSFTNTAMYNCGGVNGTFQIVLFESTNIIESHITNKPYCGWIGNVATQGIHNLPGTVAVVVPGRNGSSWVTNNDGYRYTPAGPSVPGTPTWYEVGNPVAIGTGYTMNVTPQIGTQYTCHMEYPACYAGFATCMGLGAASGPDTVLVVPGPPNPTPVILGPYDFCPDASITVSADQLYTQYLWSDGSTGPTFTTNTPGPIWVNVIDANNCTGTGNAVLNMLPNPVLNVVPVDPSICLGETIQMTVSGAMSYVWSPGSSLDYPTSNYVNATPSATTLYSIVGTDANGCKDSIFNTVTVLTPPTVTASATDPGVCPTFGTTVNAVGASNYVWSPVATMSTPNNTNSDVFPIVTTTYQVIGTDMNGCSDIDNVTVLVYDLPNVNFSAPVIDGCAPVTINFQDNSNIVTGTIATYTWNVEGQPASNQQNPTYVFTTPGIFDVQLTATSDQGCINSMSIADYINVYSVPIAGFLATPNPTDLNMPVDFTNTSSLDAVNFLWDFGGLGNSNQPSPTYLFDIPDTFDIILYVSTIHGCVDSISQPLIVQDVSEIWVPNGFTPNLDGLNETWFPVGRNLNKPNVTILVEVFDRWGVNVFTSSNSDKAWSGKSGNTTNDCPQDVYVYKVYFKNEKGEEETYSGHVSLIR